jgi:1-pyrroline-5-carboxylate dehydrogenase
LANWRFFEALEQAGLPPGVINFLPGDPAMTTRVVLQSRDFADFTSPGRRRSSGRLAQHRRERRELPQPAAHRWRDGRKDFVLAHPSADAASVTVALIRGAFEYQGQKCSAASRAYIPKSLWPRVKASLQSSSRNCESVTSPGRETFMGAVIDSASHGRLAARIENARDDSAARSSPVGRPGWIRAGSSRRR